MADREGNAVAVPDGASHDYSRQAGAGACSAEFRHPIWDSSRADHCCPRYGYIPVQRFEFFHG